MTIDSLLTASQKTADARFGGFSNAVEGGSSFR